MKFTNTLTLTCSPAAQTILWLLEGNRSEDITDAIRKTYPDQDPAALINAAGDHFATVAQADPLVIRGWCLEALREMYRRMVDIGDYAGALKAIKELMAYAKQCSANHPADAQPPAPETTTTSQSVGDDHQRHTAKASLTPNESDGSGTN